MYTCNERYSTRQKNLSLSVNGRSVYKTGKGTDLERDYKGRRTDGKQVAPVPFYVTYPGFFAVGARAPFT